MYIFKKRVYTCICTIHQSVLEHVYPRIPQTRVWLCDGVAENSKQRNSFHPKKKSF